MKLFQTLGSVIKSRLGRVVTRGRTFLPEVDGLRFVAITAVVLYHFRDFALGHDVDPHGPGSSVSAILSLGHYGVQLFFILSGFLLAMPFANWRLGYGKRPSLRSYYLRRLTRLEPPFAIAMVGLFLLGIGVHILTGSVGQSKWPGISDWPHFIATLFYQHNLIYGGTSLITPVEWSLEIEVQFYILAPLLTLPFAIPNARVRRLFFLSVILALPLLRGLASVEFWQRYNSLPAYLEFFVAGFLLADLFLADWKQAPSRSITWDIASLLGWPALVIVMLFPKYYLFVAPAALLCYIGAFRGRISSWILSRPRLTVIGGMCYSIYLVHYTVIMASSKLLRRLAINSDFIIRFAIDALVILPVVLAVSVVFFYFMERPFMNPAWPALLAQRLRGLDKIASSGEPDPVALQAVYATDSRAPVSTKATETSVEI